MALDQNNLVWIDLEMTGLSPEIDCILEIATVITDAQCTILEQGPIFVIHQSDDCLKKMSPHVRQLHETSGLLDMVRSSVITQEMAAKETLSFIQRYCIQNGGVLAGNSVWQDRAFLQQYMPDIIKHLHYRLIDVSTIKELVQRWYPENKLAKYEKQNTHRAQEDILESINELRYYRKHFFL